MQSPYISYEYRYRDINAQRPITFERVWAAGKYFMWKAEQAERTSQTANSEIILSSDDHIALDFYFYPIFSTSIYRSTDICVKRLVGMFHIQCQVLSF